jgi:hypothetical protein
MITDSVFKPDIEIHTEVYKNFSFDLLNLWANDDQI